jgi:hypothetical protein
MKTIIEMAREAGFAINELHCSPPIITFVGQEGVIEAFAALVAAAEREACAKVCDDIATEDGWEGSYANGCAVAIRARGQV